MYLWQEVGNGVSNFIQKLWYIVKESGESEMNNESKAKIRWQNKALGLFLRR